MKSLKGALWLLLTALLPVALQGASLASNSLLDRAQRADAVCLARLETGLSRSLPNGRVVSELKLLTLLELKGTLPANPQVQAPGGVVDGLGVRNSMTPALHSGQTYLFFLVLEEGTLRLLDGPGGALDPSEVTRIQGQSLGNGLDLTANSWKYPAKSTAAVTGFSTVGADSFRHVVQDSGQPIQVLYDASTTPSGISAAQARQVLENALAAWSAVTSLSFQIEGEVAFASPVSGDATDDGKIRIQFHDNFNEIGGTTLGFGGFHFYTAPSSGSGGIISGEVFERAANGYVLLNHTRPNLQTLSTLEEVLTHEIGHALGLDHSSENPSEPDTSLSEAMMYYVAKGDGRGATLQTYDITTVRRGYPEGSTPPYAYTRAVKAMTAFSAFPDATNNVFELVGLDLQGDSLTIETIESTTLSGSFSLVGSTLTYTPGGAFSDNDTGGYFDRFIYRFSDGTHTSGFYEVTITGFRRDTQPGGAPDGLPDSWMTTHFGSTSPVAGTSGAGDDPDRDGSTNLQEFRMGTDPNAASGSNFFRGTSFDASSLSFSSLSGNVYVLEKSTDLSSWSVEQMLKASGSSTTFSNISTDFSNREFWRVRFLK